MMPERVKIKDLQLDYAEGVVTGKQVSWEMANRLAMPSIYFRSLTLQRLANGFRDLSTRHGSFDSDCYNALVDQLLEFCDENSADVVLV